MADADNEIPEEIENDYRITQIRLNLLREKLMALTLEIAWEKEAFYKRHNIDIE